MGHRPGSQPKPCDSARRRGWPVRTALTYVPEWTSEISLVVSGRGSTSRTPSIGRSRSDSATQLALRVVSKE